MGLMQFGIGAIGLLTHWGRVTHICVDNLTIIASDNGLSPVRRQAIIWTNDGILLMRPLGTHFSEILIEILAFWFKKMHFKVSSAKWRPFCLGLNVFIHAFTKMDIHHMITPVSVSPLHHPPTCHPPPPPPPPPPKLFLQVKSSILLIT